MRTLCAGFAWTTIMTRLSLLDKNSGSLGFPNISLRNHIKNVMYFLTGGAYAPYATCKTMPLLQES